MFFFKVFVLLFVLSQICVGSEFSAFCDLARSVNPSTGCSSELSCANGGFESDGITATCNGGHITSLKAPGVSLKEVPSSLNDMVYLVSLNFASNEISSLPTLDGLTALESINLNKNQLTNITGVFPNSKKLVYVYICNNKLVELPPEFGNTKLTNLVFNDNVVERIPESYAGLTSLVRVEMGGNMLDCASISSSFSASSVFAKECIPAQQHTDDAYPALPTEYSTEAPKEGLDGLEIASIILACLFVVCAIVATIFYVRYRFGGLKA